MKKVVLGATIGVVLLLFFIAYEANAMEVKNNTLFTNVRDSDIIGTTIDASDIENQYVKVQYIKDWVDEFQFDEIAENYVKNNNTYKIFSGKAYHKYGDLWFEVEYATTSLAEFQKSTESQEIGLLKFLLPTKVNADTVYTGAGDGKVGYSHADWDTVHDGLTGNYVNYTNTSAETLTYGGGATDYIYRIFLPFDTSSIDDDKIIDSASLFVYVQSVVDSDNGSINVVGTTTQASPTQLVNADYDTCGSINSPQEVSTEKDVTGLSTVAYSEFVLNDAGKSVIDFTGYSLFGVRGSHDYDDIPATGESRVYLYMSEQAGTANDPYLELTLSDPPVEEEEATSTTISVPCDLVPNNELSMAVWCVEEWGTSTTTPEKTYYGYAHIPFLIWFIIAIPTLWLAGRLLLEFIIRLRRY